MNQRATAPVRLAMRVEGAMWNAYLAPIDSMKDAQLLGCISMRIVEDYPGARQDFMHMMTRIASTLIKAAYAITPDRMDARPAPEHERGGSA
jgi:hypothetical protein